LVGRIGFQDFPVDAYSSVGVDYINEDSVFSSLLSKDYLRIHVNSGKSVEKYEIVDCSGRIRQTDTFSGSRLVYDLNVSQLIEGVYFIRLIGKNIIQTEKFIR